jgi:hypothetical protein
MGDSLSRIYVVRFDDLKSFSNFNAPGIVKFMIPFFDGLGCMIALEDGSVAIASTSKVVSHFSIPGKTAVSIIPLASRIDNGLVSYLAVDRNGEMTLRVLEHVIAVLGTGVSFIDVEDDRIAVVKEGKVERLSRKALAKKSMEKLPSMELPRKSICEFLEKAHSGIEC